jgi:hypothetical protein
MNENNKKLQKVYIENGLFSRNYSTIDSRGDCGKLTKTIPATKFPQ